MARSSTSRAWLPLLLALTMIAALAPATASAADEVGGVAGDPTLTLDVGDSAAGGEVLLTFEQAYTNVTVDGTPVYVYVPQGSIGNEDIFGMSPAIDPDPTDEFEPCASKFEAGDYLVTQDQINTLGDELTSQIVRVDEEHYGFVGNAGDSGDAIVLLAYNVFDDFFYGCDETTYTAGFFAPNFIADYGMNVIVTDTFDWANRVGGADPVYEGVIAHELEHLLMNYSDPGELSWVDEGLADMAIFLNGWGNTNDSHILYHQVFHRETSLTRWGGGLENYGASYTYFLYLWEQAGGNGDGTLNADLSYDNAGGDLLIKLIFQNAADGMTGVQGAIDAFNLAGHPGRTTAMPSAEDSFKDWAVAIWLDAEVEGTQFDFANINFGDAITAGWTIEIANDVFWEGRGEYHGNMPPARWARNPNVPTQTALPFGVSYETFRNPGSTFAITLDGDDATQIVPHSGPTAWYAGYQSQFDSILDVDAAVAGGETLDFWTWYFIEEGWDYGFVEALVGTDWVTVPLIDDAGNVVTTSDNPQGNNDEGNGLTGTSGGAYFVDEPVYVHLNAEVPAGATDLRLRYSTDAAYLDTGWFVDDVMVDGTAATVSSTPGNWTESTGMQDNNWVIQVISSCDLTPGVVSPGEIVDAAGNIYRFIGDNIFQGGFNTKCLKGKNKGSLAVVISNMPTGDLTFLDANYVFRLTNTGNGRSK